MFSIARLFRLSPLVFRSSLRFVRLLTRGCIRLPGDPPERGGSQPGTDAAPPPIRCHGAVKDIYLA